MISLLRLFYFFTITFSFFVYGQRARDLGVPFEGVTEKDNAITDVNGVLVGYSTIIQNEARTGVTAVLPRGKSNNPVYAATHTLNGNGDLTGIEWVKESGFLETPIMITNTNSVGVVRDAVLKWFVENKWYGQSYWYTYPVVGETYDGLLSDICGFHIKEEHVFEALNTASEKPPKEGNVGGGTGCICFGFKGGTGTASRVVTINGVSYTVGALVQANFGVKRNLTVGGVPIGIQLDGILDYETSPFQHQSPVYNQGDGSVIVVATDAPLLPHQLKRVAARVAIGIGMVGGQGENGSGDIFIAFSTANPDSLNRKEISQVEQLPNDLINPIFAATIQSVAESVINAIVAAETMEGCSGNIVHALPHKILGDSFKK